MEMPYHPPQIKQLRAQYNVLSDHFFPYLRADLDLATSNKKPSVTADYQNSRLFSLTEKKIWLSVVSLGLIRLSTVPGNHP